MDLHDAERSVTQVGLIALPIGPALLADPSRVGRHLCGGDGRHHTALRVIGALDLALNPGLIAGRVRAPWLRARAGLHLLIAAYCARLTPQEGSAEEQVAVTAMVGATIPDSRAIAALSRPAAGP